VLLHFVVALPAGIWVRRDAFLVEGDPVDRTHALASTLRCRRFSGRPVVASTACVTPECPMVDRHWLVDERIGVLGDPHADLQWMKLAIRNLHRAGVRQVHVLGDFGFLSTGNRHERDRLRLLTMQLESRDMFLYVTGGNHEGYPALHRLFPVDEWGYRRLSRRIIWLPRGWRGTTAAGAAVASLGGANSINRGRRDPSVSGHVAAWHPEEQITEEDLKALGPDPVDVLLGHDAPISRALQRHVARQRRFWTPDDIAYASAGQAMFHRGVLQVRPKLVLSGHYHHYLDTTLRLQPREQETATVRSVILDRNRTAHSVAILHVDAIQVDAHPKLSPGLRRQRN
jgi:hypothetical protein